MNKHLDNIETCLALLEAITLIEYHDKNYLPTKFVSDPKTLNEAKQELIERAKKNLQCIKFIKPQTITKPELEKMTSDFITGEDLYRKMRLAEEKKMDVGDGEAYGFKDNPQFGVLNLTGS